MTQWVNQTLSTASITIEYGYTPSFDYYTRVARDGLIVALGGTFVR